ncbi:GntR family transcriptional regulator [Streptomyces sp. NPDC058373]|uniref:GntR family transcriptional regulator n=1 Tax=unclassified Streptomyces TaxID=2593676 RepID=UPI00364654B4
MTVSVEEFFAEPMTAPVGQPLRVAVYTRLAAGIRSQVFPLGSPLPKESELGVRLGVSRTVVREALMLLEEDGLIHTRRGVGRFVAAQLPRAGLERLRPLEDAIAAQGLPVQVERLQAKVQRASDFVAQGLRLETDADSFFWESRLTRAGEPVALVHEHLPADGRLRAVSPALAELLRTPADPERTVLGAVTRKLGPVFNSGECRITVGTADTARAELLEVEIGEPLLVLTQTATHAGRPAYLAKYLVRAAEPLSVLQAPQSSP